MYRPQTATMAPFGLLRDEGSMPKPSYRWQRVLLKVSGEALAGDHAQNIDPKVIFLDSLQTRKGKYFMILLHLLSTSLNLWQIVIIIFMSLHEYFKEFFHGKEQSKGGSLFYFRFADWTGSELNKFNLFNRNLGWARNWDLLSFEHLTFRDLVLI